MATVVNNPAGRTTEESSVGTVLAVIIALVAIVLFFVYGVPAIRQSRAPNTSNIQVDMPTPNTGGSPNGNTDGGSTGAGG